MEAIVKKLSVDANFKSLHSFPQLDVAITADELMNMPEEAIHSFKISSALAIIQSVKRMMIRYWKIL